jgi:hypothetical protein
VLMAVRPHNAPALFFSDFRRYWGVLDNPFTRRY